MNFWQIINQYYDQAKSLFSHEANNAALKASIAAGEVSLNKAVQSSSYAELNRILSMECPEIIEQACTRNDNFKLPIELLIARTDINAADLRELSMKLILIMTHLEMKPLAHKVTVRELTSELKHKVNKKDMRLYLIACRLINATRAAITTSSSHADSNQLNVDQLFAIEDKRERIASQITLAFRLERKLPVSTQENILKFLEKHGIGNCHEMAIYAYLTCHRDYPHVPVKCFEIKNGDHAFIVLGEEEQQIICDPWAGEAYPFADYKKRLHDFRQVRCINTLLFFNDKHQTIEPIEYLNKPLENYETAGCNTASFS